MVQPRHRNPNGGTQSIQHSLLQSNSGMVTGQGSPTASQIGFSSMASPRTHFGNMNMLGNVPNESSLLHQSFPNGAPNSGVYGNGNSQRALTDNGAEVDILSGVGNGMGFNQPSSSLTSNTSGQVQAQQISNMFENQILTNPVNVEPQMVNDHTSEQLQTLRILESQLQGMRSLPQVSMETHHTDPSMFLQQQQQQQFLQSQQNPQAAAILQQHQHQHQHQQRFVQLQQQQHQQLNLLNSMPPERSTLQPQFPSQNLPMRSPVTPLYEPGMCAGRVAYYLHRQKHRPNDNNIEFWKRFVAEFFAPNAKKRWCVSMHKSGRKIIPQDVWHCEICNRKPGRGFEATVEVLPRLFKIKYDSGTLEELLYLDMPREYQNSSGQIVVDYAKVVQQSVFEKLQVVRDGHLRLVFSSDLKICSWDFCARHHEELIPKKLLVPQVNELGVAVQKYQATSQNSSSNTSVSDLQKICNMFVTSARSLEKTLDVDLVNKLGYTKRFVRCLQISEVANRMKGLMDYSRENKIGPIESFAKFPRRPSSSSAFCTQQPEDQIQHPHLPSQNQQTVGQNSNNDISSQNPAMRPASGNRMAHVSTGFSASNIAARMHMNSIQQNLANGSNYPCAGNGVQMPSPGSSMPQSQTNLSTFHSPAASTFNHLPHSSHGGMSDGTHINYAGFPNISIQQPALSGDVDGGGVILPEFGPEKHS